MGEAFKSGCIRGPYPGEWDAGTAWRIGRYLPGLLGVDRIVIGRDVRLSSKEIFDNLSLGITESGADVYDIGVVDTPALYLANVIHSFNASIMITASHNPLGDNGLKIHRANAVPVDSKTGLKELERLVELDPEKVQGKISARKGVVHFIDIGVDYLKFLSRYREGIKPVRVVLDCSNGSACIFIHKILEGLPGQYTLINDKPDGRFPGHGPNPLKRENLEQLIRKVKEEKAEMGICFDGDGDRAIFVDENGSVIVPDIILAFLSRYYFIHFPQEKKGDDGIIYDLRSSSSVREYVEKIGGKAYLTRTGHTAIQSCILQNKGLIGAELAGHYYFRDYFGQDSAMIAVLMALAVLSNETRPFSSIIKEIDKYAFSGEINFNVKNPLNIMNSLEAAYKSSGGTVDRTEGIKINFDRWWFLARVSNTEPVLRLVVEAENKASMSEKIGELTKIINSEG